jgi:hypothetical protein
LGLILTIYGAIKLYRVMSFERNLAIFGILVVISQLLITMVTIGDHRFRVPIMPISLMFQAIALKSIFRINKQQI